MILSLQTTTSMGKHNMYTGQHMYNTV